PVQPAYRAEDTNRYGCLGYKQVLKDYLTPRRTNMRMPIVLSFLFQLLAAIAVADDWPQWLGPGRNDVWKETGIVEKFPEGGPKVLWRVPIAGGYSGPAVSGGKVFVTDYVRTSGDASNDPMTRAELTGKERVLCLRASDGRELWQ